MSASIPESDLQPALLRNDAIYQERALGRRAQTIEIGRARQRIASRGRASAPFCMRLSSLRVPAGGEKERNAARHVRVDLCLQRLEGYLEQRPKQHRHSDEIKEEPRRRCEALRGEGRQRAEFARLSQ